MIKNCKDLEEWIKNNAKIDGTYETSMFRFVSYRMAFKRPLMPADLAEMYLRGIPEMSIRRAQTWLDEWIREESEHLFCYGALAMEFADANSVKELRKDQQDQLEEAVNDQLVALLKEFFWK